MHNGEKKTMEAYKLCTNHDQKLYPNLLANETVLHLNKKYCYICSSKFIKMGHLVECTRLLYQKKGVRTPWKSTRSAPKSRTRSKAWSMPAI